jgi:putative ABC transport system permease protein
MYVARRLGWRGVWTRDSRLDEEVRHHLDALTEDFRRRGLPAGEAREAALRSFGGVDRIKLLHREQASLPVLDAATQDARFALRLFRRDRGFAATAILVLGIGIGVNNMMFTLIYSYTMRGLPIERADRVLHIGAFDERFPDRALSYPDFIDLQDSARGFVGIAAYTTAPVAVGDEDRAPDRFTGTYLSANALSLMGAAPVLGRTFNAAEDRPGSPTLVIIGDKAWHSRYDRDPAILGRSILVNGRPAIVIGVMPSPSGFPSTAEIWLPLTHAPGLALDKRDARTLRVFGRRRDEVQPDDARAEIESIIARIAEAHPETSKGLRGRVVPIDTRFFGSPTQPAWRAFTAAGVLIVIVSCANTANLMLARAVARRREIAVRHALGAGRARIVAQLLMEAVVLASASGVVGLGISRAAIALFRLGVPSDAMPYWFAYTMDWRIFGALVVVTFSTVLVFGLIPALQASRTEVNRVLRDGGRTGTAKSTRGFTTAFLVAELAVAVVLLAQALVGTLEDRIRVPSDHTLDTTHVLTASITLPAASYPTSEQRNDFYARLDARLRAIAEVSDVSNTTSLPLGGGVEQRLEIDGAMAQQQAPTVLTVSIGPRYFETLAVPLERGRAFSSADASPGSATAIVNEELARRHFAGVDPIGHRVRVSAASGDDAPWRTIVGVARNIRQRTFLDADPIVYLPFHASPPTTASLVVRSTAETTAMALAIRREAMRVDANLPLYRLMTMREALDEAQWNPRQSGRLLWMLTLIALALSVVGLYAVTAHAVGYRTPEIGIRMALGARSAQVRALVLRRAAGQVVMGLGFGILATIAWNAAFHTESTGIVSIKADVLFVVAVIIAAMFLLACFFPARRAARLDPISALRDE